MSIQSIVIASDLSERSDRALQRGGLRARELGARVTLVSVVDDSVPESMAAKLVEKCPNQLGASAARLAGGGQASDDARAIRHETEEQAASGSQGLPSDLWEVELTHDGLGASLRKAARDFGPDLIALGATTRSISFTDLGSFTSDLVRDPPADILIARGSTSQ